MNDIKLESCPVCGSDPVFTENFSEEIKLAVRCEHCSLVFPLVFGVDEWNESIIYQRGKTIASEIIKTVELGDLCAVHISSSNVELAMQVRTALHANQGVPEVMIFIGDDLELMDEDRMRECGWVKKEESIPVHPCIMQLDKLHSALTQLTTDELKGGGWWMDSCTELDKSAFTEAGLKVQDDSAWGGNRFTKSYFCEVEDFNGAHRAHGSTDFYWLKQIHRKDNNFYWGAPE